MSVPQAGDSNQHSGNRGDDEVSQDRPERRQGPADRRGNNQERRNAERVVQDVLPRRDPEHMDRRER